MLDWPPLCVVRARDEIKLLVPAPGVEGTVQSYSENGDLGIVAPATLPHPEHGWGTVTPGQLLAATVKADWLVLVREGEWSRADVEAAIS
jgi:hypothetical protein